LRFRFNVSEEAKQRGEDALNAIVRVLVDQLLMPKDLMAGIENVPQFAGLCKR